MDARPVLSDRAGRRPGRVAAPGATGIVAPMLCPHRHPRAAGLALALADWRRGPGRGRLPPGARAAAPAPEPAPEAVAAGAADGAGPRSRWRPPPSPPRSRPAARVTLLWRLRRRAGWHLYWYGRNDSGFAPRLKLALPPGWTRRPAAVAGAGAPRVGRRHPRPRLPRRTGRCCRTVTAPPTPAPGSASSCAPAGSGWPAATAACRAATRCVVALAVDRGRAGDAAPSPALAAARARLPRPLPDGLVRADLGGRHAATRSRVAGLRRSADVHAGRRLRRTGRPAARRRGREPGAAPGRRRRARAARPRARCCCSWRSAGGPARAFTIDVPADNRAGSDPPAHSANGG